jgi:uncharacterized DUF497 family protein
MGRADTNRSGVKYKFIFDDGAHSEQEHREIIIGRSALRKMVLVCFVERLNTLFGLLVRVQPHARK